MPEAVINEREQQHAARLVASKEPIPQWWYRRSALLTFLFNTSSATVPDGERFIVHAVKDGLVFVDDEELTRKGETLIHEELAHARMHDAYNRYLVELGLPAMKYNRETKDLLQFFDRHLSVTSRLAVCTMIEHFTALFSKQILDTGILEGEDVDERMDRVWSWHCLEEIEHRTTAIDIYRAIGGGYFERVWWAWFTSLLFAYMHTRCLFAFLRAKKVLWKWSTWFVGIPYVFGKKGVYRLFFFHWIRIFVPGFHPTDIKINNRFNKQLHHYHIEEELVGYFPKEV